MEEDENSVMTIPVSYRAYL